MIAILLPIILLAPSGRHRAEAGETHFVQPGDTWAALSAAYNVSDDALRQANPHFNGRQQPIIGTTVNLPAGAVGRPGTLIRPIDGGLLATAVRLDASPWALARSNDLSSPFRPPLGRPLFWSGGEALPRDWPDGIEAIELLPTTAVPGQALALRARTERSDITIALRAAGQAARPFDLFIHEGKLAALAATGAFFPSGDHWLEIGAPGETVWSQPWRMVAGEWTFDDITLTGEAAAIDQQSIADERARLFELWAVRTAEPLWTGDFDWPIVDYLTFSSAYGARRSYNGGPYRTYHEGLDFSAFGGTAVYAPAAGRVVVAERLYVRGGAVIIDQGWGVFSGLYHLSAVHVSPGEMVEPGQLVGEVGTTGLSTGNHLHWDILVGETWVDPAAWRNGRMGCWLLAAWERPCQPLSAGE